MGNRVGPVAVAAAAVAAGVVAVVVLAVDDDDAVPGGDPVAGFLADYERSRTGTFVVEQQFTRVAPDGAELAIERRLAQRPPDDRLLVGGGAAEGRLDGRIVRCFTNPDGSSRCDEGPPAPPYDEEVADELAELGEQVGGSNPLYAVSAGDDGCWELTLRLDLPSPPYGEAATFCFDDVTGAPTLVVIRRPEAVDTVEAVEIRPQVTAADLRPDDLGDLPG